VVVVVVAVDMGMGSAVLIVVVEERVPPRVAAVLVGATFVEDGLG